MTLTGVVGSRRAGWPSSIVCDVPTARTAVGTAVRKVLAAPGPVVIVSPYVGGAFTALTGLPRRRWNAVTLICDVATGQCDPRVLRDLDAEGATVVTLAGLHAKLYLTSGAAVLGSGNLSSNGLGSGSVEAGVCITDAKSLAQLHQWATRLTRDATNLRRRLRDPVAYAALMTRWARHRAGLRHPEKKLSLLAALESNHQLLRDYRFSLYWNEDQDVPEHVVRAICAREQRPLPDDGRWSYYTEPYTEEGAARVSTMRDKEYEAVALRVTGPEPLVQRIAGIDGVTERVDHVIAQGGYLITVVRLDRRPPFTVGGTDGKTLRAHWNAALQDPAWQDRISHEQGTFVTPKLLRSLLQAGTARR